MREQKLTEWLKAGYPHFKKHSGVPEWLLPERSFSKVVEGFGEDIIVESSHYLNLLPYSANKIPKHESLPAETWQEVCFDWPHLSLVSSVITSLFESVERIMAKYNRGYLTIELPVIFRSLAVISFAPFIPQGRTVLQNIAELLEGDTADPAELVRRYTDAILQGVSMTAMSVIKCIDSHPEWTCWADLLQRMALEFNGDYKMVAIAPPPSEGLADVLVEMIKEAPDYGA